MRPTFYSAKICTGLVLFAAGCGVPSNDPNVQKLQERETRVAPSRLVAIGYLNIGSASLATAIYEIDNHAGARRQQDSSPIGWLGKRGCLAVLTPDGVAFVDPTDWSAKEQFPVPGINSSAASPTSLDVSADGKFLVAWQHGGLYVLDLEQNERVAWFDNAQMARLTNTNRIHVGGFGEGLFWCPAGEMLAVSIPSETDFEEASGSHFPYTWLLDHKAKTAKWLATGFPVGWVSEDAVATLDWSWKLGEALGKLRVITINGETLFEIENVVSAGAGNGCIAVVRRDRDSNYSMDVIEHQSQRVVNTFPLPEYSPAWTNSGRIILIFDK